MFSILAESFLHAFDPFAIHFTRDTGVRWYGLAYVVGFLLAWLIIRWFAKTGRSPLGVKDIGDLMFVSILGVLLGGRLGYALFYDRSLLFDFSSDFPWWSLLAINRGGMAAHGGIIGVIAAVWIFARQRRFSSLHILDMASFACTPGLFLGRIANFINAELWGKPLPPHMQSYVPGAGPGGGGLSGIDPPWWSMKYPQEVLEVWLSSQPADPRLELLAPLESVVANSEHFYTNVVAAAQAGDAQVIATLQPLLTAYYPSQIFQAITDGPILMGALALLWLRPRKPGVIGSWFLIVYGVLRIITELFRQPDEGVALTFGLLSRGQTLSALMIVSGLIGLAITTRREAAKYGGLLRH